MGRSGEQNADSEAHGSGAQAAFADRQDLQHDARRAHAGSGRGGGSTGAEREATAAAMAERMAERGEPPHRASAPLSTVLSNSTAETRSRSRSTVGEISRGGTSASTGSRNASSVSGGNLDSLGHGRASLVAAAGTSPPSDLDSLDRVPLSGQSPPAGSRRTPGGHATSAGRRPLQSMFSASSKHSLLSMLEGGGGGSSGGEEEEEEEEEEEDYETAPEAEEGAFSGAEEGGRGGGRGAEATQQLAWRQAGLAGRQHVSSPARYTSRLDAAAAAVEAVDAELSLGGSGGIGGGGIGGIGGGGSQQWGGSATNLRPGGHFTLRLLRRCSSSAAPPACDLIEQELFADQSAGGNGGNAPPHSPTSSIAPLSPPSPHQQHHHHQLDSLALTLSSLTSRPQAAAPPGGSPARRLVLGGGIQHLAAQQDAAAGIGFGSRMASGSTHVPSRLSSHLDSFEGLLLQQQQQHSAQGLSRATG
jgi:hypothetical protein